MERPDTYYATVVVETAKGIHRFSNATVKIAAPGFVVIGDTNQVQLGMFPIGVVDNILYPDGEMKVVSL